MQQTAPLLFLFRSFSSSSSRECFAAARTSCARTSYVYVQNVPFLHIFELFSGGHGSFSQSRMRSTQGARGYPMAQVWAPSGHRGACSGRPKSSKLFFFQGIAFRGAETSRSVETPKMSFFRFFSVCFVVSLCWCKHHSSPQTLSRHGATSAAPQDFPFVTATNGASACLLLCVSVMLGSYSSSSTQEHSRFKKRGAI